MAILGPCLSVLAACIVVSAPLVQGRSLRLRHGHRSHHSDYYSPEESLPRDLSGRPGDDLDYHRDSYGQAKRREHPRVLDRFSEYEDWGDPRVPPSFRRYKHEYDSRGRESLRREEKDSPRKYDGLDDALSTRSVARRKRHNKHDSAVTYRRVNESGRRGHAGAAMPHPGENGNFSFELEVKEAQNRSMCNYTVESIPDTRGSRVPRDLEHVRCNHIGSRCQDTGTYCCVQTYRNIEVSYGNGDRETMKLYVGCVCALQAFSPIQESRLSVND